MVDIRLISILPTPGVQQPQSVSQGSAGAPGVFITFPPGSILSGFIVNRDATGNPVLRTESGDVTFQTNFFLKIGSEVVIRVETRGNAPQAHIISVNGQPPEMVAVAAEPQANTDKGVIISRTLAQNAPPPAAQTNAPTTTVVRAPTIAVTGVLLTPLPGTPPDAPEPPPLVFRVVQLQTPTPPPAYTVDNPATQTPYAAYARTVASVPSTAPSNPSTTLPPVQPVTLQTPATSNPVATPPPAQAAASQTQATPLPVSNAPPTPLITGQVFTAPVLSIEPTGEPLVQTPAGIVRLQGTQLPPNSKITLEVLPSQTPIATSGPLPAALPELARQWTSLSQIATLLAARPDAPAPWLSLVHSPTAPTLSQQISSGLMVFVAALRGGNFHNWLGEDNVRFLQQTGHEPLVRKAEAEFMTLVRAFTEPSAQTGSWQSLFFPVAVDGQLQQVRMFLKRDRKNSKKPEGKPEDDTRFIVEMNLSQMGEMQLDGFVRRAAEKMVEFDLFIRSLSPLETAIQQDIQRIYGDIGQITGYRGKLLFQAVREFPVNPMKEAMAASGGVIA